MKTIIKGITAIAGVALLCAACSNQTIEINRASRTLTVKATAEELKAPQPLKSSISGNTIVWGSSEKMVLALNCNEGESFVKSESMDGASQPTASFSFTLDGTLTGPYSVGGVYPASSAIYLDGTAPASAFRVDLPAVQSATATSYDPAAFIMVAKPETFSELPSEWTASFRRAVALNAVTLTGISDDILEVSITAPSGKYFAGKRLVDLTTGDSGKIFNAGTETVTVQYAAGNELSGGSDMTVWFTSWEVVVAGGEDLTIVAKSKDKVYSRTITARSEGILFMEGCLNKLEVSMAGTDEAIDWSGVYSIVAKADGDSYACQAYANANKLGSAKLSVEDGDLTFSSKSFYDKGKFTVTKIEGGKYTIQDCNSMYLYAAGGASANWLKGEATPDTDGNAYFDIYMQMGEFNIKALGNTDRNLLLFRTDELNFTCYSQTTAKQVRVSLIPYTEMKYKEAEKLTVTADFSGSATFPSGFPTGQANASKGVEGTFSFGGYPFTFYGTADNGYYRATAGDGYLMIGKAGAYILTPAIEERSLTEIVLTAGNTQKPNIDILSADGSKTISAAQLWGGTIGASYKYSFSGAENTSYRIDVKNAAQAPISSIVLTYE
ncbi:MAG: hypothetical protein KBS55_00800 [Bacteroidales bacterium]|nr:hypothetical protein [Candidatus Cryptobacteroides aphodequi]